MIRNMSTSNAMIEFSITPVGGDEHLLRLA